MDMTFFNNNIAYIKAEQSGYCQDFPYDPPENYPEFSQADGINKNNHVYRAVRDVFAGLKLDEKHYGTANWNPFGNIVKPGMTVFVKTNTVRHENLSGQNVFSVIIHASILRPVLDYLLIALQGKGRIILGDSQVIVGNFDKAMEISGIASLLEWYRKRTEIPIECLDLRINKSRRTWLYGKWGRTKIEMDPRGYRFVDLGDLSYFKNIDPSKLRIGIASYREMYKHHSKGRHEYLFPNSYLESDVVINIPKLKTHRRTGVTLAIKNFMGLPSLKDTLPHFTVGSPEEGGDQYIHKSFRKEMGTKMHDIIQSNPYVPVKFLFAVIKKLNWNSRRLLPFKDDIYEAMWPGNDTVWRTLLDLNRAAIYTDKKGRFRDTPQRGYFCLLDGLVGGEKDGPVAPDPVDSRVLLGGFNPVAMDCVATTAMGFSIKKLRLITRGLEDNTHKLPLFEGTAEDIGVFHNAKRMDLGDFGKAVNLHFEPHPNWKGYMEKEGDL